MSHQVVVVALSGLLVYLLDAVTWGTTGYVVFRRLGGRDDRWWLGAIALFVVYVALDELPTMLMARTMQFHVGDASVAELMGGGMDQFEVTDMIWALGVAFIGFRVGRRLVRALVGPAASSGPNPEVGAAA